jgi:very-short-patch-repair endonuclease
MTQKPDAAIARTALGQHGVFSRAQAQSVGITRKMIEVRLSQRLWERIDFGIYRMVATPSTWHQRLVAACLVGPAVASHRSAGQLWSYPGMPPNPVEVTALRHRRRKAGDVVWHESYLLTPDQITELDGIQVTGALRTFLDLAGVLDRDHLEEVRNDGIRRNLFTAASGLTLLERLGPRRRAVPLARSLLEAALTTEAIPQSVLETRFLQLLRRACLPKPAAQYPVSYGLRTIHVDFAYPDARLAIELDGDAYHWGERADRRDNERNRFLARLQWRVQRFTWHDITRRENEVVRDVTEALRPLRDASLMLLWGA